MILLNIQFEQRLSNLTINQHHYHPEVAYLGSTNVAAMGIPVYRTHAAEKLPTADMATYKQPAESPP